MPPITPSPENTKQPSPTAQLFLSDLIRLLFHALFFVTPFVLLPWTSELFEFNKMIFVYTITCLIVLVWLLHLPFTGRFPFQRTKLDIPLLLFLTANIVTTITSVHPQTSIWGYYSRFQGGLASIAAFITLYYAFVTFFRNASPTPSKVLPLNEGELEGVTTENKIATTASQKLPIPNLTSPPDQLTTLFKTILTSTTLIAIYGIAQHFGIDAHLWKPDVQHRIFATLGQPNWLAAYLVAVLPLSWYFLLQTKFTTTNKTSPSFLASNYYLITTGILYLALLYTRSKSGFLAFLAAYGIFWGIAIINSARSKTKAQISTVISSFLTVTAVSVILSITSSTPFTPSALDTLSQSADSPAPIQPSHPLVEIGGTDSGKIRQIVWQGAWNLGQKYPFIGTGLETFGYTYYWTRPSEHNLVSEWDFLYNKAHNEYLNYWATTGLFGTGTYLVMIITVLWISFQAITSHKKHKPGTVALKNKTTPTVTQKSPDHQQTNSLLITALLAGYSSILITNFFGFSVVVVALFFYLIPAMIISVTPRFLSSRLNLPTNSTPPTSFVKILVITTIILIILWPLTGIYQIFRSDLYYATARRVYRHVSADPSDNEFTYTDSLKLISQAIELNPRQPIFYDQAADITTDLAIQTHFNNQATASAKMVEATVNFSQIAVELNPYHVNFRKNQAANYIAISTINRQYLDQAIDSLIAAQSLAPTDAKIPYNIALIHARKSDYPKAVEILEHTLELKPNYTDAVFAIAIYLHIIATDEQNQITDPALHQRAIEYLEFLLQLNPNHSLGQQRLTQWTQQAASNSAELIP